MMRQLENRPRERRWWRHREGVEVHSLEKAMLRSIGILGVSAALCGLACGKPAPPADPAPDPSQFSGERAWEHLERLVEIGPRVAGTPGAEAARSYIRAQLEAIGLEPKPLSFDVSYELQEGEVETAGFESVLAEAPGESADLLVLAAPFDSRHFESFTHVGANNGASGAALLLEMARVLSVDPVPYTVWFAFLDAEAVHVEDADPDQRFLGSRALVGEIQQVGALSRTRLMIYFNQVADGDLEIARDLHSERVIRRSFQHAAKNLGYEAVFPPDRPFSRPPGGHGAFLGVGFRRVMIVSDDRFGGGQAPGVYWQTEEDTLEHCDPESLAIVGTVSLAGLREVVALLQKVDRFSRKPVPPPEVAPADAVESVAPDSPRNVEEEVVPSP
jgi:glutaminyl-peptide cyclotransferase